MNSARTTALTPTLYVIGTPIGNIEDITLRAKKVLGELTQLMSEDTRETKKLMQLCGISLHGKEFHSFAKHNMKVAVNTALGILQRGQSLGILSDRGVPAISDPGALLVSGASKLGFPIIPIPGVSSVTTAFSISGFESSQFQFLGFVPNTKEKRTTFLTEIAQSSIPSVFFEAPHRILETLEGLKTLGTGSLCIARELTKQFESLMWIQCPDIDLKTIPELGEFTLAYMPEKKTESIDLVRQHLDELIQMRLATEKEWAKVIAKKVGIAANEIYNSLQKAKLTRPI